MPSNKNKGISVIGIDGLLALGERAEELLQEAATVLTSKRLEEMLRQYAIYPSIKDKLKVITAIGETIEFLKGAMGPCAVIASGDPLFYGIGSKIMDALPEAEVELLPALSSVQVAFARVGLSWHDAELVSLHGSVRRKWVVDDLPLLCERYPKLVILTGGENTPEKLAQLLPSDSTVHVLERLGYPDERVSKGTPEEVSKMEYKDPNIMIVLTAQSGAPVFGLNEAEFRHERSLITKDEVRAVAIHKLRLPLNGIFWDIGAGSGSVGIEAKKMSPGLQVYAIEKDPARASDIRHNASVLAAGEITIIEGEAPGALVDIPKPDRVFIGGSGNAIPDVIRAVDKAMDSGITVVSVITIESLSEAVATFKEMGQTPEVTSLAVSRSRDVGGREYLKAENQVFLITVKKPIAG